MTAKSKADIVTEITTLLADNVSGEISALDVRNVVTNLLDSLAADIPSAGVLEFNRASIGNVIAGNYTSFDTEGTLRSHGEATTWDDLRFPATALNPPGAVNDADRDITDTVYIGTLLFASNATEIVCGIAQMPHTWKEGSVIKPHVHWAPTTADAGDVRWQLSYDIADVNGNFSGTYTNLITDVIADGDPTKHQFKGLGDIDMTGYALSAVILWKLSRISGAAEDTYPADARLIEFDIHYEIDGFGSDEEFTK